MKLIPRQSPLTLIQTLCLQVFPIRYRKPKTIFRTRSIIATAIIILLSSVGTYFISRRALLPLRRLSNEVNKIEAQNLSESLEVPDTNDEISRLTGSFNKMLSRLDDAFTAQKQFSASAAHELRTPLAVMQTNLEVFARKKTPTIEEYQDIFGMIQNQTERLSHLSEVLLDMTGIQSVERSDSISLAELTDEVCCDLAAIADQKKVELIQEEGDCTVTGSYLLLYRAVYNLVENAIKYNHSGGKVTVKISQTKALPAAHSKPADYALVEVTDTGIGISPEYQEKNLRPVFPRRQIPQPRHGWGRSWPCPGSRDCQTTWRPGKSSGEQQKRQHDRTHAAHKFTINCNLNTIIFILSIIEDFLWI